MHTKMTADPAGSLSSPRRVSSDTLTFLNTGRAPHDALGFYVRDVHQLPTDVLKVMCSGFRRMPPLCKAWRSHHSSPDDE